MENSGVWPRVTCAADHPDDPNVGQFNAPLICAEYRESVRAGDWQAAIKHSVAEIGLMDAELEKCPDNAVYWQHLSIALLNNGVLMAERADVKDGIARMRRAIALAERIVAKDSVNYVVLSGLTRRYMQLERALVRLGPNAETLEAYTESIRRWELLAKRDLANY